MHDSERFFIREESKEDIWKLCHIERISLSCDKHSANTKLHVTYFLVLFNNITSYNCFFIREYKKSFFVLKEANLIIIFSVKILQKKPVIP